MFQGFGFRLCVTFYRVSRGADGVKEAACASSSLAIGLSVLSGRSWCM